MLNELGGDPLSRMHWKCPKINRKIVSYAARPSPEHIVSGGSLLVFGEYIMFLYLLHDGRYDKAGSSTCRLPPAGRLVGARPMLDSLVTFGWE